MSKRAQPLLAVVSFAIATATSLVCSSARAEGSIDYFLEARPYTCSQYLPALARELTLACDAAGGMCAVARNEESAKRYLVFHCSSGASNDAWTVEGTDEKGVHRWSADLAGPPEDRMRMAAMWVVRAEGGDTHVAPAAPDRAPTAAKASADKDEVEEQTTASRGSSLMIAARTALGFTYAAEAGQTIGVSGMWGGHVIPEVNFGVAVGYDRTLHIANRVMSSNANNSGHAGLVLGLGAPFDVKAYGIQVDAGPGLTDADTGLRTYWYARGAVTAQLSPAERSRPWAALSFTQATNDAGPLQRLFSLDVGLAWSP